MTSVQDRLKLNIVIKAIEAAGYSPYAQLTGYRATGDAVYITRYGGARTMVRDLNRETIVQYLSDNRRASAV